MITYTKRNVRMITLTITVIIYVIISVICFKLNENEVYTNSTQEEIISIQNCVNFNTYKKLEENIKNNMEENIEETTAPNEDKLHIWEIQIPAINLEANIEEGTDQNVIARNVGHFTKTSTLNGNIGLAAHNRGFGVESYFKNIKSLNLGDEIIYKRDQEVKKYRVAKNVIIDETDWTYLQNTNDNRITLITCVEGKPEYRRCIQAVEIS